VYKVGKKTLALGIEKHGTFHLGHCKEEKEYALMSKTSQNSSYDFASKV